ncbi:SAM and SH3 domain-containing protein 3 isoform X2 [Cololabis saira]|uniref:SAM and SH3 domain-containing protein 3 isoform X2 n=1 Tax=Cololabis saira TaxID=129043 RepID=UPI002AD32058|nr:SAM and SH3 domain-containing protein 3 isoform X2 [Cololabis saira]
MLRRRPSNASEKEQGQGQKKKEADVGTDEAVKSTSKLGKKWRNVISRTMTRKTSKMVQKALAEEGGESGEDLSPVSADWLPDLTAGQRTSVCSTGSEDTMPSPITRQLSGSSDRQSLDSGYCQRDSMRLEDNGVPYNGPFCGRALVHTDFTPSPYDIDSLKLQKGDIIHIIDKPPVGTWTGKLNNNKVGSFKFIYVNLLPDETESPPTRTKHRQRNSRRAKSRPKTLEEVLDGIGLTELSPLLSMHGFQSLEDFAGLKESHLNELNIMDPEQRSKILNTTDQLRESEEESEPEEEEDEEARSVEDAKEPRDSGCFESSENLESGREEPKTEDETNDETEKHEQESEESKETPTEQLEAVEEQLQELTVDEEP